MLSGMTPSNFTLKLTMNILNVNLLKNLKIKLLNKIGYWNTYIIILVNNIKVIVLYIRIACHEN